MKFKKTVYIFLTAALSSFFLSSCHDNIYELIEKEVKISKDGLNGDINSITECGGYLFLSRGDIFAKEAVQSSTLNGRNNGWKQVNKPQGSKSDFRVPAIAPFLASDGKFLYALSYTWDEGEDGNNTPDTVKVFAAQIESPFTNIDWKSVDISSINPSEKYGVQKIIFDNKSKTSGAAYVKIRSVNSTDYEIYKLNGTETPSLVSISGANSIDSEKNDIINCVNFNGTDYFSKYYAMTSNDKFLYYAPSYTRGSSNYISSDTCIYYSATPGTAGSFTKKKTDHFIYSIAITKDYLLFGTSRGLEHMLLDEATGVPVETKGFSNNGGSVISEHVYMVYVLDSTLNEAMTDMYAASTIYGSISSSTDSYELGGLYAYYPKNGDWDFTK